jgi:hypothetical protein
VVALNGRNSCAISRISIEFRASGGGTIQAVSRGDAQASSAQDPWACRGSCRGPAGRRRSPDRASCLSRRGRRTSGRRGTVGGAQGWVPGCGLAWSRKNAKRRTVASAGVGRCGKGLRGSWDVRGHRRSLTGGGGSCEQC